MITVPLMRFSGSRTLPGQRWGWMDGSLQSTCGLAEVLRDPVQDHLTEEETVALPQRRFEERLQPGQ